MTVRHVEILTEFDVHQIAYLTMHGWHCTDVGTIWTKPGKARHVLNDNLEQVLSFLWTREDAYWEQRGEEP